jgi:hypothetical protein
VRLRDGGGPASNSVDEKNLFRRKKVFALRQGSTFCWSVSSQKNAIFITPLLKTATLLFFEPRAYMNELNIGWAIIKDLLT